MDRTAPILRVLSPAPDEPQSPVVEVRSEVTDLSPVRVTVNWVNSTDVGAGTNVATNTVTLSNPGHNVVLVRATDAAGNTTEQVVLVLVE
ncbi:hypothetical protein HV824_23570 [Myxococcus sp. AM009]|uniref:hypothetical protein n=1 Tax=unclassified Myxococcus TaxID=2648731 RepID=UPI001595F49D|nr:MULTISPECIES: hypothetical protein [unclassified Myxococcus]NVJ01075.1 hypothetical protein [Myxococcus sp. AM009]NVJ18594.1 hypothetical protein [Myxococcus sp. AM010]